MSLAPAHPRPAPAAPLTQAATDPQAYRRQFAC